MPDPLIIDSFAGGGGARRALIGCETSGVFRRAFAVRWPDWDIWSCDLEPAEDGSNRHIIGDVRDRLDDGWDLLIVCHPPCTRLCNSGVRWLDSPVQKRAPDDATAEEKAWWPTLDLTARRAIMQRLLREGVALFAACWQAPVPRVAIENPVMHKHGRALLPADLPAPHTVQPWWFGNPAKKATGWYLRGLPKLVATDRLTPPPTGSAEAKAWEQVHRASPGKNRARERSRSFPGMAAAAADQWGAAALMKRDLPPGASEKVGGVASACSALVMRRELDGNHSRQTSGDRSERRLFLDAPRGVDDPNSRGGCKADTVQQSLTAGETAPNFAAALGVAG
jgi:hypothetical protein